MLPSVLILQFSFRYLLDAFGSLLDWLVVISSCGTLLNSLTIPTSASATCPIGSSRLLGVCLGGWYCFLFWVLVQNPVLSLYRSPLVIWVLGNLIRSVIHQFWRFSGFFVLPHIFCIFEFAKLSGTCSGSGVMVVSISFFSTKSIPNDDLLSLEPLFYCFLILLSLFR